jgi:hypothetical protein
MNDPGLVLGILLIAVGAIVLADAYLYPEPVRRRNRRVRNLLRRTRAAGLRGRYKFESDRSKWDSTGEFASYEPVDGEDRVLYAAVGPRIEGESEFYAGEMWWTTVRIAWVGVPALVAGAVVCAVSVLA